MLLSAISKEQRFEALKGELSYDPMYQKDMDIAYHYTVLLRKKEEENGKENENKTEDKC